MLFVGLFFIGIWAGGKAKQRGMNKWLWTLIPIGLYFIVYIIALFIMNIVLKVVVAPTEDRYSNLLMVIEFALIPLSFLISKLIMDEIFRRINNSEKK